MENTITQKITELEKEIALKKNFLDEFKEWNESTDKMEKIILHKGRVDTFTFENDDIDLTVIVNLDNISKILEAEITTMKNELKRLLQEKFKELD